MRLLAAAGEPLQALRQYRDLERRLKEEIHTIPGAATRALARAIERKQADDADTPPPLLPALPAAANHASHLPVSLTRFFGREEEIERLETMALSEKMRLVTLTGPPGSGKTRLALEAAKRLAERFRGAVWFVPLADISDPGLIVDTMLAALKIPRSPQVEPLEQVVERLSRQPGLLVLDNFEHLLGKSGESGGKTAILPDSQDSQDFPCASVVKEEGSRIVRTLLERVPQLTCLVTSRQRLNLSGERELPVMPLPVPGDGDAPEQLMSCPSVQLFVDRAQGVRPDFLVTEANAAAVAGLCNWLEGLPLALELAAARAVVLSPVQMLTYLSHRLDFLASRWRDVETRHRTLRAAVEWSYQLLEPEVQRFFVHLSVFRGGWTVEAAEAVCQEPQAIECLTQLAECSLILAEDRGPERRYRMLEMLWEYGREQMGPEEWAALSRRHAEFYLRLAEEAEPKLKGPEQLAWLSRLETEQDNLRAALAWSISQAGEAILGLRLAGALGWFWYLRSYYEEGDKWLALVIARTEDQECGTASAKAIHMAGWITRRLRGNEVAPPTFEQGLALARELGDPRSLADALTGLGQADDYGDFASARLLLEEALSLYRGIGDAWGMANALNAMGNVAWELKEWAQAGRVFEESLGWFRKAGDRWGIGWTLHALGRVAGQTGDDQVARALYEESLGCFREMDYIEGMTSALSFLAGTAMKKSDYPQARSLHEERLALYRRTGFKKAIGGSLRYIGQIAYLQGEVEEAIRLHQESLRVCQETGDKQAIPVCLLHLALAVKARGQAEHAARLMGAADALREGVTSIALGSSADKIDSDLRQAISKAAFTAAWEAGRKMTLEEAVEYALEGSKGG